MFILITIVHTFCFAEGRLLNVDAISKEFSPEQSTPTIFIADVIRSFNWTSVSIVYDTSSEHTVSTLQSVMASKRPSCKILDFNIDTTDMNYTLKTVYFVMFPSVNIVLLCNPIHALFALKTANNYDTTSNRTSDYRHLSKWIVLAERSTLHDILLLSLDLENVLFVSPLSQLRRETEGVAVSTLHGTGTAGRLVPVTSFQMTEAFPNMKYGLNKRTLLVSTIKGPYNHQSVSSVWNHNTMKILTGVTMKVLNAVAQQLNFSIQVIEPPDNAWGEQENGTWTGLIGQLQKREVDMVAALLTISDDRAAVMDYLLPPVLTSYVRVMYREPDVDQYRWLLLLKPFKQMVFLVYGGCVACVLLVYGVTQFHPGHGSPRDTVHRKTEVLSSMSWFILGSMLKQGGTHTFTGASGRVLTFFWWIFLVVITSVYTAKMVAFLSVKKSEPPPFTNLHELSQRLDYTIGFALDGFFQTYFQNSKRDDVKQVWKRIQQQHVTDPRVLSVNYSYHVSKMKKEKYAAVVATVISDSYMAQECKITYLKERLQHDQMAFGLPTSSPLKPELERVMHMLVDTGLTEKWMQEFGFLSDKSGCRSEKLVTAVTLDDVGGGLAAVAGGAGLALLTLAVECLYHLYIRPRNGIAA